MGCFMTSMRSWIDIHKYGGGVTAPNYTSAG